MNVHSDIVLQSSLMPLLEKNPVPEEQENERTYKYITSLIITVGSYNDNSNTPVLKCPYTVTSYTITIVSDRCSESRPNSIFE